MGSKLVHPFSSIKDAASIFFVRTNQEMMIKFFRALRPRVATFDAA